MVTDKKLKLKEKAKEKRNKLCFMFFGILVHRKSRQQGIKVMLFSLLQVWCWSACPPRCYWSSLPLWLGGSYEDDSTPANPLYAYSLTSEENHVAALWLFEPQQLWTMAQFARAHAWYKAPHMESSVPSFDTHIGKKMSTTLKELFHQI